MFNLSLTKVLHIEPTTVCQAACPQCDRENLSLYNDKINRHNLTLEQVKQVVPISVVENLDKVFMCGVFGDPAAGTETINILKWFRSINPTITLGMNTNGGLRDKKWWTELGNLFSQPLDYVVFSIDGLEDTNYIYRRNVKWNNVIENAHAYITTGASAHWDMLVFDHNKHQVEQAEHLAKSLGFKWFRCKVSSRFYNKPVNGLSPPDGIVPPQVVNPTKIKCHALEERSMYIAANGELLPCCWIGNRIFNRDIILDQALNTENFSGVCNSWATDDPLPVCTKSCGVTDDDTVIFKKQFVKNIQL